MPDKKYLPTVFVIFGVTGDLVKSKIAGSLFSLYKQDKLPKAFQVYGFSRKSLTDEQLRDYWGDILKSEKPKSKLNAFLANINYVKGDFHDPHAYKTLSHKLGKIDNEWQICANKLFYLAAPPQHYETILNNLKDSGLTDPCSSEEGWTRVILEKPFGYDLDSAIKMDKLLGKLFEEVQIYRVDHYLAKETVRNILNFRFNNTFLQPAWNNKHIGKIEIRVLEKEGIKDRGEFYDAIGALRDVGQSHMLQLLALFTMEPPESGLSAEAIRTKKAHAISCLEKIPKSKIPALTARAQYSEYTRSKGIKKNSKTETYFKIKTQISKGPLQGVPVYLESGKAVGRDQVDVKVHFRPYDPCDCQPDDHFHNILNYEIQPNEKFTITSLVKKPGNTDEVVTQDFGFSYAQAYSKQDLVDAYEQLLLDIIEGDQTRFISTEEVLAQWRFVEPILEQWQSSHETLSKYKKGTLPELNLQDDHHERMPKEVGIIGLGKMGSGIALQLIKKGWHVAGYNRSDQPTQALKGQGLNPAFSVKELVSKLKSPRVVWVMVPAGKPVDQVLFSQTGLINYLQKGDIVIDAGNSYYKNSIKRDKKLASKGIKFIDVGVSGGPHGARFGACMMVGGRSALYEYLLPLFSDTTVVGGHEHFNGLGAGHFVKMVHNGIEYGMMQSIAEGFTVLKKSHFNLNLKKVAKIYNNGSVIESHLMKWLQEAYDEYDENLTSISGSVDHTGEGEWTIKVADEAKLKTPVIKEAFRFRVKSAKSPSYTGKIVSALRGQFGGHEVKKKGKK